MTVCITAQGDTPQAEVDARFGRAAYFCYYDSDTNEFVFEENAFAGGSGGVGVRSATHIVEKGVKLVITGRVGPNAERVLTAGGVVAREIAGGTVAEAACAAVVGPATESSP